MLATRTALLVGLLAAVAVVLTTALVPPRDPLKSFQSTASVNNHGGRATRTRTMTMYFDDVSRHSMQWNPSDVGGDIRSKHQPTAPAPGSSFPSLSDQKMGAIQRMLLGYDASTASLLTPEEIEEQMAIWAEKSGVVGNYFGDELFQQVVGSAVCNATSTVGALAQFWSVIAGIIDEHTDEFYPLRWTTKTNAASPADSKSGDVAGDKVHFVIFPSCPELYDYKSMFTFVTAVEFSKELCLHLGKRFSLTLFHPKFKDSPKMLSPERHSPFPVSGLQFHQASRVVTEPHEPPKKPPKRQRGNTFKSGVQVPAEDEDDEDERLVPIIQGRLFDISEQRDRLEVLFNSAAVSGSDTDSVGTIVDYYDNGSDDTSKTATMLGDGDDDDDSPSPEGEMLTTDFRRERQMRRRSLPRSKVIAISKAWIEEHRFTDDRRTVENLALQFVDSVPDDRWTISDHKVAEYVYADIWNAISELYDIGMEAEKDLVLQKQLRQEAAKDGESASKDDSASGDGHYDHFSFMKTLVRPFQLKASDGDEQRKQKKQRRPVVVSSMFLTTKFCGFNAQQFRRFAITVNAGLKRLTNGRMFLEVFHNEYTGQSGFNNKLRRSPFPMIQICFEVAPDS